MAEQQDPTSPGDDAITMMDPAGRIVRIPRDKWRGEILPANLKASWDKPDQLLAIVMDSLNKGLEEDVLDAAVHLSKIPSHAEQGAVLHSHILATQEKYDDALQAVEAFLNGREPTAAALTQKAKVMIAMDMPAMARPLLDMAVSLDPNLPATLDTLAYLARQDGGDDNAVGTLLADLADKRGSWRARLLIARQALHERKTADAIAGFQRVLQDAPDSGEAFVVITGDLGNAGQFDTIVEHYAPRFDLEKHGPYSGMNVLKAMLGSGRVDGAPALVGKLKSLNFLPIAAALGDVERQLAARHAGKTASTPENPQISIFPLTGPLWLMGLRRPMWLVPAPDRHAPRIAVFTYSSALAAKAAAGGARTEMEDDAGRLTRALPLYLAEALGYTTTSRVSVLVPVAMDIGPVVFGKPLPIEQILPGIPADEMPDVLITGLLNRGPQGRVVDTYIIDVRARRMVKMVQTRVRDDFDSAVLDVETEVTRALVDNRMAIIREVPPGTSPWAKPPFGSQAFYVNCLGQLLVQVLVIYKLMPASKIWNEAGLLENYFRMAASMPQSLPALLMAVSGTLASRQYNPAGAEPFVQRLVEVLKSAQHPAVKAILAAVYAQLDQPADMAAIRDELLPAARGPLKAWLESLDKPETPPGTPPATTGGQS